MTRLGGISSTGTPTLGGECRVKSPPPWMTLGNQIMGLDKAGCQMWALGDDWDQIWGPWVLLGSRSRVPILGRHGNSGPLIRSLGPSKTPYLVPIFIQGPLLSRPLIWSPETSRDPIRYSGPQFHPGPLICSLVFNQDFLFCTKGPSRAPH